MQAAKRAVLFFILLESLFWNLSFAQQFQKETNAVFKLQDSLSKEAFLIRQSNPGQAFKLAKSAHTIAQSLNNESAIASSAFVLGIVSIDLGKYQEAMNYLVNSLAIYERLHSNKRILSVYNGIGYLYHTIKVDKNAIDAYQRALQIAINLKDTTGIAAINNNIGESYIELDSIEKAQKYIERALQLNTIKENRLFRLTNLGNLGIISLKKEDYRTAINQLTEVDAGFRDMGQKSSYLESTYNLALAYQNEYPKRSLRLLDSADSLAQVLSAENILLDIYNAKASNYELLDEVDSTVTYFKKAQELRERLENNQTAIDINAINTSYFESQNKVKMTQHYLKKRGFLIFLSILVTVLFLISLWFYHKLRKEKSQIQLKNKNLLDLVNEKNKKLTTNNLRLIEKNDQLQEIKKELVLLSRKKSPSNTQLQSVNNLINKSLRNTKNWETFTLLFEQTNEDFSKALLNRYEGMTPSDYKLAALIRLGFSTKDICHILGISPDSAKTARWRLRKKLNLQRSENLETFLSKF